MNAEMEALLKEAEDGHLWLRAVYHQGLWLTPKELRAAQADGRLRWGVTNWELRNPMDEFTRYEQEISKLQSEFAAFKARIINY